jgi:hypothetical protein
MVIVGNGVEYEMEVGREDAMGNWRSGEGCYIEIVLG